MGRKFKNTKGGIVLIANYSPEPTSLSLASALQLVWLRENHLILSSLSNKSL